MKPMAFHGVRTTNAIGTTPIGPRDAAGGRAAWWGIASGTLCVLLVVAGCSPPEVAPPPPPEPRILPRAQGDAFSDRSLRRPPATTPDYSVRSAPMFTRTERRVIPSDEPITVRPTLESRFSRLVDVAACGDLGAPSASTLSIAASVGTDGDVYGVSVSGPISNTARRCLVAQLQSRTVPGEIERAERIHIELPIRAQPGATRTVQVAPSLPSTAGPSIMGPAGLSIQGARGAEIRGPAGNSIRGPQGVAIQGPSGVSIMGPAGQSIGE